MRIFVINLDKDRERLRFAQEQANEKGFCFERVRGIYGRDLTEADLKECVDFFRYKLSLGRRPGLGEIGCNLSHLSVYRKMVDENITAACILEDDIFVLDHFTEQLERLSKWMDPKRPIVVRLNMPIEGNLDGEIVASRDNSEFSACSYCLTLEAAKALLKDNFPINTYADNWPRWCKYGIIELYNSHPRVCWHNNAASGFTSVIAETNKKEKKENEPTFFAVLNRKLTKGFGQIYEMIYRKIYK